MISAFLGMLTGLVGWLASHLPNSPIRQIAFDSADGIGHWTIAELLAWANWLIPFGTMLTVLEGWLAAAIAFIAIRLILKLLRLRGKAAL